MKWSKFSKFSAYARAESHLVHQTVHGGLGRSARHDMHEAETNVMGICRITIAKCKFLLNPFWPVCSMTAPNLGSVLQWPPLGASWPLSCLALSLSSIGLPNMSRWYISQHTQVFHREWHLCLTAYNSNQPELNVGESHLSALLLTRDDTYGAPLWGALTGSDRFKTAFRMRTQCCGVRNDYYPSGLSLKESSPDVVDDCGHNKGDVFALLLRHHVPKSPMPR